MSVELADNPFTCVEKEIQDNQTENGQKVIFLILLDWMLNLRTIIQNNETYTGLDQEEMQK